MKSETEPAPEAALSSFGRDVREGLTQTPKRLPSKYFYDAEGDRLFQQIMRMPEYYLTDCELEILQTHKQAILDRIGGAPFDLIELGAGDGFKTKVLLRHFLEQEADVRYEPVDISVNVLRQLEADLRRSLPDLPVRSLPGDYFEVLENVNRQNGKKKVILFMGANIGNLTAERAQSFLRRIGDNMHRGDQLLVGFDLKKDPEVILRAYDDPAGITAAFNLNLLTRINRELGGRFDLERFRHWETYDPASGATRSYLVSLTEQTVTIDALDLEVPFDAWEAINVELSLKYSLRQIEALAPATGFRVVEHYFDRRRYFVDSLWEK